MENPGYSKAAAKHQAAEDRADAYETMWENLLTTPKYKMSGDLVLELVGELKEDQWKFLAGKFDEYLAGKIGPGDFTEALENTMNEINTEFAKAHASSVIYGDDNGNV